MENSFVQHVCRKYEEHGGTRLSEIGSDCSCHRQSRLKVLSRNQIAIRFIVRSPIRNYIIVPRDLSLLNEKMRMNGVIKLANDKRKVIRYSRKVGRMGNSLGVSSLKA